MIVALMTIIMILIVFWAHVAAVIVLALVPFSIDHYQIKNWLITINVSAVVGVYGEFMTVAASLLAIDAGICIWPICTTSLLYSCFEDDVDLCHVQLIGKSYIIKIFMANL